MVRDLDANQHTEEVLGGLLGWWSHSGVLLLAASQTQVIKGKNEFSFYAVVPCGVNKRVEARSCGTHENGESNATADIHRLESEVICHFRRHTSFAVNLLVRYPTATYLCWQGEYAQL